MAENPNAYPQPMDPRLWDGVAGADPAKDFTVAVDPATGQALAVWEGTSARPGRVFPEGTQFVQVRQPNRTRARQVGEFQFKQQQQQL